MELFHLPALTHLVFFLAPTVFAGCLPQSISIADGSVTWLSPRFRYYTAVRLLTELHSPLRFRL